MEKARDKAARRAQRKLAAAEGRPEEPVETPEEMQGLSPESDEPDESGEPERTE